MCNEVFDLVSSWNVYNYYDNSFKPLNNLVRKTFLIESSLSSALSILNEKFYYTNAYRD